MISKKYTDRLYKYIVNNLDKPEIISIVNNLDIGTETLRVLKRKLNNYLVNCSVTFYVPQSSTLIEEKIRKLNISNKKRLNIVQSDELIAGLVMYNAWEVTDLSIATNIKNILKK